MNPQSNKQRSLSRGAALWAAGCVAAALWAGAAAAKADTDARRELVLRYLRAVYAQDHAEAYRYISQRDRQAKSEAEYLRENGSLEVRVRDHRNAIDDFRSVDLRLGKLRLAPYPGLRSSEPGWLELAPQLERLDLTRYKDGTSSVAVYRGRLRPRRFAAVDLQLTGIEGILRETGRPDPVKNAVGPIRLDFELKPGATTVVVLDLELLDLSDHPGRGYELLVKGYELYENDRLLQKIPPG